MPTKQRNRSKFFRLQACAAELCLQSQYQERDAGDDRCWMGQSRMSCDALRTKRLLPLLYLWYMKHESNHKVFIQSKYLLGDYPKGDGSLMRKLESIKIWLLI